MANSLANVTVSSILKNKSSFEDEPRKKSREDWRKAKELEEARKAGTAPAAVDEEGKDINPHIPQYISATPWYFGAQGPTLKHQRPQSEKQKQYSSINSWYNRGVDNSKAVGKYRKNACENCGAITHKRKECMERPRRVGAKYTNSKIAPDEFTQPELSMDYDGKRDRWAGYDPSEHRAIVEEYQKVEEAKRQMRAEKLNAEENDEQDSDKDEDKYVDEVDMPGTKVDSKQRITVRNLRIREDTAKYLRNLDPNSAYYDPKTRSMRDNPYVGTEREVDYKGENFVRFSGDTQQHANAQLFAWEAHEKGVDVHLLAEPTKLELLKQEYDKKRDELKDKARDSIIEWYGGEEHLEAPPKTLLLAQTEHYVEYSRYGKVVKGQDRQVIRSKYEEDVYPNNHTSVWGSYWQDGKWGYQCCYSFIKNSYCTGESGKKSAEAAISNAQDKVSIASVETEELESNESRRLSDTAGKDRSSSSESSSDDDDDEDTKNKIERQSKAAKRRLKKQKRKESRKNRRKIEKQEDKLKEALRMEEEYAKEADKLLRMDERKRPYNSIYEAKEPTNEEIEAYQMKRKRDEDPMANFL
ncbi:PREDICTED: pre-mRNA-splicing factor Slu7-like [Dinoponera quadriceps]|uniref:Pre-mRNA-splicing factor SLU7 n=1 Tax=Dinoponera quadriceps TaxID=609295 RepID=A0A6P3WPE2_DINQU|nr:PREDICTED: pre-mRNA-splicing factor Slu7-like [Dinoponera quadriceps]XP_014467718.1 PREDICTED: pre-mRNA-splicing factor Slu7-like [Dinoponera quadriceps]XP_014467720.1 PREDICTED: pre-mRNA-splicing factor Slu7-like [Dinoponera quadriceps]XP_014467721.1 PREDICTED: pre-mRNA-splicing factor Slu7-like [Dinoponera quadriceps]